MKPVKLFPMYKWVFNVFSIIMITSMLAAGSSTSAAAKSSSQAASPVSANQQNLDQCLGAAGKTSNNPLTGVIGFVGASPVKPIQQTVEGLQAASPEVAARSYLSGCGSIFGLSGEANELTLTNSRPTGDGRNVVRFQQNYQGIPVFGGELLMQLTSNNNVLLVNGSVLPGIKLNTKPGVDATTAQAAALQLVAGKYGVSADALKVNDAKLWVYSPRLIESRNGPTALVWRMEITPQTLAPIRELVLINAQDGSVVLDINQVDTALDRKTYTANNTTTQPGTLLCDEVDLVCGNTDATNAHNFAADTYNFYFTNHSRDSIDGAGMTLISTVHFDVGFCNAFWDGLQMTYGDGCSIVVDDVVGHELTHGVTEKTSGLVYAYQSGAINESFSDIWGEFIDLSTTSGGADTAGNRWQVGEDTTGGPWGDGMLRDMQDPTIFGDPDRMGSANYYTGADDNGGVHTNSGVGNKTAFLISDGTTNEPGGTFNGYTIAGIGTTKAAKIYYEVQTNIFVSTSNYHSLYDALSQACTTLVGTAGITSGDCLEVVKATNATELNLLPLPPPPPANDNFASATVIASLPYTQTQDISTATTQASDPVFSCTSLQNTNSVWYNITPASSGTLTVNTTGSNFDTVLGIWKGYPAVGFTSLGCNDDIDFAGGNYQSKVVIPVTAGQTYRIEAAGYSGAASLKINVSLAPAIPATISPAGTITDTTPTFTWKKVTGATQYRFELMKGATPIYTITVASSVCSTTTCQSTPATVLVPAVYKWRVQAKIGGLWKPYSAYRTFTLSPAKPGFWSGSATEFYVTPGVKVDEFAIYVTVNGCGNYKITHSTLASIVNKKFSFSGTFYASGTFNTPTSATGTLGLSLFNIPGCGNVNLGPFAWNATWKNSNQPAITISLDENSVFTIQPKLEILPKDWFTIDPANP